MSDVRIFNIQGQIESVKTRKGDKSLLLTVSTQEIRPEEAGLIMMMQDKHIYFFMSEQAFEAEEIVELIPEPKSQTSKYSKSQILRFELQKLHKVMNGNNDGFEAYYQEIMQKLIDQYKAKITELQNK